jgi:molecular chaperone DnaK (HSP70)
MFCRQMALQCSTISSAIIRRQKHLVDASFSGQRIPVLLRGLKTRVLSTQLPSRDVPNPLDKQTSLAWLQLHNHSPASYGVQGFDGYLELIPPKTPLPCKRSELIESALDYVRRVSVGIYYRQTMLDAPVAIARDAVLDNIRLSKKGQAKFKVTMRMDKDLAGSVTVQDTWTKSTVAVDFDGGRLLQTRKGDNALITSSPVAK